MLRRILMLLLLGACAGALGCETQKQSPVGSSFIGRHSGGLVDLPAIPLSEGNSFLELIAPGGAGLDPALLVGRMNGLLFRSLLRFHVPVDSLSQAAGGAGAEDLTVDSLHVVLGVRRLYLASGQELAVYRPETAWSDTSDFIDPVTFREIDFRVSPIEGARVSVVGGDSLRVGFPTGYFTEARARNPQNPTLEFLLNPEGEDFLIDLISEDSEAFGTELRRPRIEVFYSVANTQGRFEAGVGEDTFLVTREGDGPPTDLLMISKGHFYSTILKFDLPESIPSNVTINSALLEVDPDLDRSFLDILPFALYLVDIRTTPSDTIFTPALSGLSFEEDTRHVRLPPELVQGWLSGSLINEGLALRAQPPIQVSWLVLKAVRLKLIYSLPPEF